MTPALYRLTPSVACSIRTFENCGKGRSSCEREIVAWLASGPAPCTPKNGFATLWLNTADPSAKYFGSSWLMLTAVSTVPPIGRGWPRGPRERRAVGPVPGAGEPTPEI